MKKTTRPCLMLIVCLFFLNRVNAQPQPTLPRLNLEIYATGFDSITDIANAGDARLFVAEQHGQINIIDGNGNVLPTLFLDIRNLLNLSGNERGLLGLTFDPNYAANGYFYVNYTAAPTGETHISRFQVTSDPNVADPNSEVIILTQAQPFANHNAGDLNFGPDGYLYFGLGDGGSAGDPLENAQNGSTLLGKMIRIDVSTLPYTIPPDNPFISDPNVLDEIWAIGLRNPYRFSFDRMTGDMWIGDVGQNLFEEVNFEPASSNGGMNWGWDCFEGFEVFETDGCGQASEYDFPVFSYGITGEHCAVQGGFVYRGNDYPVMQGHYVFGDFCSGRLWTLYPDGSGGFTHSTQLQFNPFDLTTFGEDMNGELYAGGRAGNVYRITDISCKNNNIMICHTAGNNNKTLCIGFDETEIQMHLDHGDQLGSCNGNNRMAGSSSDLQLNIHPNPSADVVNIQITTPVNQYLNIEIYDLQGKRVMNLFNGVVENSNALSLKVSKSDLNSGIYLLKILGNGIAENYKVVIE